MERPDLGQLEFTIEGLLRDKNVSFSDTDDLLQKLRRLDLVHKIQEEGFIESETDRLTGVRGYDDSQVLSTDFRLREFLRARAREGHLHAFIHTSKGMSPARVIAPMRCSYTAIVETITVPTVQTPVQNTPGFHPPPPLDNLPPPHFRYPQFPRGHRSSECTQPSSNSKSRLRPGRAHQTHVGSGQEAKRGSA